MTKRVSKAKAKVAMFIEAYCDDPKRNGTKAAVKAGYAKKSARFTASKLIADPNISQQIQRRLDELLEKAREKTQLTAEEVMRSLARDIRFDPAKMLGKDGQLLPIAEMDEDTRLALRGMEHFAEFQGSGEDREHVGTTTKVKFPEKTAAREQGMKHFGLYEMDNKQKPPAVLMPGVRTVKFQPITGRKQA